jgi:hypothetical protein
LSHERSVRRSGHMILNVGTVGSLRICLANDPQVRNMDFAREQG